MTQIKLYRMAEVVRITGLRPSTVYKQIREGRFPKPIKITSRTSAWTNKSIDNWIEEKLDRESP